MKNPQEVFDRIQELKKEQREVRKDYKYLLDNSGTYAELTEEMKVLRDKKKKIEEANMPDRLIELKDSITELNEMLSDIAVNTLLSGKSVYLKDSNDTEYEPIHKITFKRVK